MLPFSGDTKELTIRGGHLGPYMWPKAISMIANGDLPLDEIITHALPLKDFKKGIDKVCIGCKEYSKPYYLYSRFLLARIISK